MDIIAVVNVMNLAYQQLVCGKFFLNEVSIEPCLLLNMVYTCDGILNQSSEFLTFIVIFRHQYHVDIIDS
jgi:hypothetical protein